MNEISINTSQNVNLIFYTADFGIRLAAYLIDVLIKYSYLFLAHLFFMDILQLDVLFTDYFERTAYWIIISSPVIFYSLITEYYLNGQTVGKLILNIRVVKIDGYQAGLWDYFIRWILRLVDMGVTFGIGAMIAINANTKNQRIGDIAAGTAVIKLKHNINISHTILEHVSTNYIPTYPEVVKLSDKDLQIIKDVYSDALSTNDYKLLDRLAERVEKTMQIYRKQNTSWAFISVVLKDYTHYTQNDI